MIRLTKTRTLPLRALVILSPILLFSTAFASAQDTKVVFLGLTARELVLIGVALSSALTAIFAPIWVAKAKERREAANLELFIKTDIVLRRAYLEGTIKTLRSSLDNTGSVDWAEPHLVPQSGNVPVVNLSIDKRDLNIEHLEILFRYYQNHSGVYEIAADCRSDEFKALSRDRKISIYTYFLTMFEEQLKQGDLYLTQRYSKKFLEAVIESENEQSNSN